MSALSRRQSFFDQLRADIATYNRQDSRYPLLRNFSPFYGHSWADGVANVIRAVKADQVSLRLQAEFFEKSKKPLETKQ